MRLYFRLSTAPCLLANKLILWHPVDEVRCPSVWNAALVWSVMGHEPKRRDERLHAPDHRLECAPVAPRRVLTNAGRLALCRWSSRRSSCAFMWAPHPRCAGGPLGCSPAAPSCQRRGCTRIAAGTPAPSARSLGGLCAIRGRRSGVSADSSLWPSSLGWLLPRVCRYAGCLVVAGRHSLWSLAGVRPECLTQPPSPHAGGARHGTATAAAAGVDGAGGCSAPANFSWAHASVPELRAHLVRAADVGGRLVCHDVPEEPVFLHLPPAADGSGGYHDRAGRFVCQTGRRFAPGEEWTVFFFSAANFNPRLRSYLQHMLVMLRYAPDQGLRTSVVDEVFPSEFGKWELGTPTFDVCSVSAPAARGASSATCSPRPTMLPSSR